jgi:hypothetical protein
MKDMPVKGSNSGTRNLAKGTSPQRSDGSIAVIPESFSDGLPKL